MRFFLLIVSIGLYVELYTTIFVCIYVPLRVYLDFRIFYSMFTFMLVAAHLSDTYSSICMHVAKCNV